jgi:hypothetical protein
MITKKTFEITCDSCKTTKIEVVVESVHEIHNATCKQGWVTLTQPTQNVCPECKKLKRL